MAICAIYLLPSLIEKAPLSHSSFSAGSSRWFSGLRKQKSNWFGHLRLSAQAQSQIKSQSHSQSQLQLQYRCQSQFLVPFSYPNRKTMRRVEFVFYFTCFFFCYVKSKVLVIFFLGFGSEVNRLDGDKSREYKCHHNGGTYKTKGERVEALLGKDIGESGYILIDLLNDSQCTFMFPNHFEI